MGCGCRGKGKRYINDGTSSLEDFAYLTPRQLRLLEQKKAQEDNIKKEETE